MVSTIEALQNLLLTFLLWRLLLLPSWGVFESDILSRTNEERKEGRKARRMEGIEGKKEGLKVVR